MTFGWGNGDGWNFGYAGYWPDYRGQGCGKEYGNGLGNSSDDTIVPRGRKDITFLHFIFDRSTVGVIGAVT